MHFYFNFVAIIIIIIYFFFMALVVGEENTGNIDTGE